MKKDNCDFLDIPFDVNTGILGMVWSKHLPHRSFFTYFINKMIETGQMDSILKKWLSKPKDDCGSNGEFVSMGLENMVSAFAMILTSVVFAFLLLWFEVVLQTYYRKKSNSGSEDSKGKIERTF